MVEFLSISQKKVKLPAGHNAIIDTKKIEDYCLNSNHPVGKHKAKVFHSVLGLTSEDSGLLIRQMLEKLPESEAKKRYEDEFGRKYMTAHTAS